MRKLELLWEERILATKAYSMDLARDPRGSPECGVGSSNGTPLKGIKMDFYDFSGFKLASFLAILGLFWP